MLKRKQILLIIFCAADLLNPTSITKVLAVQPTDNTTTTKHYHFPFVHVDVARHKDGSKDYDVKAPFTRVHNPAGADNAEVKAPFYKAEPSNKNTLSKKNTK